MDGCGQWSDFVSFHLEDIFTGVEITLGSQKINLRVRVA